MRLRLTSFGDLRVQLAPGWYQLPSHTTLVERRRLLDLLAQTLGGRWTIVECEWDELEHFEGPLSAESLMHVSVPAGVAPKLRDESWRRLRPRVALYTVREPGRWPEVSWDERHVKSPLAAWLRRSLTDPTHPLARLGVAELPIDRLVAATTEPVELLDLVERTVAHAGQRAADGLAVDWQEAVAWSIARRLSRRMRGVEPGLRVALLRTIARAVDGGLSTEVSDDELMALARVGLAHESDGVGVLVPLARQAADPGVRAGLEDLGMFVELARPKGAPRRRARSPAEAVIALEPSARIGPGDPRFVDMRDYLPWVADFARRFLALLRPDEGLVRLVILQQPGSGADTMIRGLLHELRTTDGVVTVTVTGLRPIAAELHQSELWLAMLRSLLDWVVSEGEPLIPTEALDRLCTWLSEQGVAPPRSEWWAIEASAPNSEFVLDWLRRLEDRARGGEAASLRGRTREVMWHLRRVVDEVQWHLAARGVRLCLRVEGLPQPQQSRVEAVLLDSIEELSGLACNLVLSMSFAPELGRPRPVSEQLATLVYGERPADGVSVRGPLMNATTALLSSRVDLGSVFEDVERAIELLADFGHVGEVLKLARIACVGAGQGRVPTTAIARAREQSAAELRQHVRPEFSLGLLVADRDPAHQPEVWMVEAGAVLARNDGGWVLHPFLEASPEFRAVTLRAHGVAALLDANYPSAVEYLSGAAALAQSSSLVGTQQHAELCATLSDALFLADAWADAIAQSLLALKIAGSVAEFSDESFVSTRKRRLRGFLAAALLSERYDGELVLSALDVAYEGVESDRLQEDPLFRALSIVWSEDLASLSKEEVEANPNPLLIRNAQSIARGLPATHPFRLALESE